MVNNLCLVQFIPSEFSVWAPLGPAPHVSADFYITAGLDVCHTVLTREAPGTEKESSDSHCLLSPPSPPSGHMFWGPNMLVSAVYFSTSSSVF